MLCGDVDNSGSVGVFCGCGGCVGVFVLWRVIVDGLFATCL